MGWKKSSRIRNEKSVRYLRNISECISYNSILNGKKGSFAIKAEHVYVSSTIRVWPKTFLFSPCGIGWHKNCCDSNPLCTSHIFRADSPRDVFLWTWTRQVSFSTMWTSLWMLFSGMSPYFLLAEVFQLFLKQVAISAWRSSEPHRLEPQEASSCLELHSIEQNIVHIWNRN